MMEQIQKMAIFMLRWSILCKTASLHEPLYYNNTHRCGSLYVDKTCIIHTWIQSGHMHVHACPKSAYVCDMHDKHVAWKFWAIWSEEEEERILLSQRSKIQKLLEHAPRFPIWVAFGNYLHVVSESLLASYS